MIKKLVSQTLVYGVSATTAKFLNYLLTPFLTRVLTESVYGEMSYLYSIIPFANVLLTMGFATGFFRFAAAAETIDKQKSLFTTLWVAVSGFALLFFGVGAALFPSDIVIVMLALILVDNIAAIPMSLLRQQGRAGYYTAVNVTGVVVNVALCFAFYRMIDGATSSAIWVLVANLIASGISLLMLLPSAIAMACKKIDWGVLKQVALYSLPLMVAGVMGVASDFIDRQMLRWVLPDDVALAELGIYSSVAKIAALMVIFRQIYSLGAEPFFLQRFSRDDFSRLNAAALKYFTVVGLAIFLGIMLFSDVFGLILGDAFRSGMGILPILLVANLLSGILINLSFWYKVADKTHFAIIVTLVGVVLSVGLNLLFIPRLGYSGAAWARVAATGAMVVLSYALGQRHYRVDYDLGAIGLYVILAGAIFGVSFATAYLPMWVEYSANFLLLLGFALFFVKREKIFKR